MIKIINYSLILILFPVFVCATNFHIGTDIGFRSDLSLQAYGTVSNFAAGFPLKIRLAANYSMLDPGKPWAARRVFINNATTGTPEKEGWMWDVRLDFLYKVNWFSLKNAYFFVGPRYSLFTARFDFVGGNEDFDIYSDAWGIGTGMETHYAITQKIDLVLGAGLDYYVTDHMHGHDTTYYENGDIVNGREDYNYDDADKAINQPKLLPLISIGINYLFH